MPTSIEEAFRIVRARGMQCGMPTVEAMAFGAFALLALATLAAAKQLDDRERRLGAEAKSTKASDGGPVSVEPSARDSGIPHRERPSLPSTPPG